MNITTLALCAQTLLTFHVDGDGPVRFGVPLPAAALTRGLRVDGSPDARMQWSLLHENAPATGDRVWVELAIDGQRGRGRIVGGGAARVDPAAGPVAQMVEDVQALPDVHRAHRSWHWAGEVVDRWDRSTLNRGSGDDSVGEDVIGQHVDRSEPWVDPDQPWAPGESHTAVSADWVSRRARVRIDDEFWRRAGVLPKADGSGTVWRRELLAGVDELRRRAAPGSRGLGDYVRGDPLRELTVTNLEYDTCLALARLALATGDVDVLEMAWQSARHLSDHDLDHRSGLPFRHGRDHRDARPELGHVWMTGLLLVGAVHAEREWIGAARSIGRALGASMITRVRPEGVADRLRDEAWPLLELENLLRFEDSPPIRAACEAIAQSMLERWEPTLETFRYGENETTGAALRDRIWQTVGIAVPALEAYADRTGDPRIGAIVASVRSRVEALLRTGQVGVPLRVFAGPDGIFGELRRESVPEAFLLCDGLDPAARRRLLQRAGVRAGLDGALDPTADDFATRFTLIGRCTWIYR